VVCGKGRRSLLPLQEIGGFKEEIDLLSTGSTGILLAIGLYTYTDLNLYGNHTTSLGKQVHWPEMRDHPEERKYQEGGLRTNQEGAIR
jgi:hypothetical protein